MSARINPTNIDTLPTVLTADEASDVLRCTVERVYELANSGQLQRLAYAQRKMLFWNREVLRFLREQSQPRVRRAETAEGPS